VRTYRDLALVLGLTAMAFVWWIGAVVTVEWIGHQIL